MTTFQRYHEYRAKGGTMSYDEWVYHTCRRNRRDLRRAIVLILVFVLIAVLLAGCAVPRHDTVTLRVVYTKGGYTYARHSYRLYRAKLDTVLPVGSAVPAVYCNDRSNPAVFVRIR